ncbi:IS5/IS1182 family transposase, partial [Acinetobacter baumannii]|nr:IS5/IS1182 family transposase [Acinetobacter baumannii]
MNKPTPKIYRTTNCPTYKRALINRWNIAISFDSNTHWYA